ncbi:MAG: hypothetical protein ACFB6R_17680 [Alphaproteobacteria bacterium]
MAGLVGTLLLTGCSAPDPEPDWALGDCRAINLVDRFGQVPIRGIEDLVINPRTGIAYLSAYDRFALDDALEADGGGSLRRAESLPRGGIYALDLDRVSDAVADPGPPPTLAVRELTGAFVGTVDFRPHGLDLYDTPLGRPLLAAVVHKYVPVRTRLERRSGVVLYAINDGRLDEISRIFHDDLCQANDVAIVGPRTLLVTRDHGSCRVWAALEEILALKRSSVMRLTLTPDGGLSRAPVPVAGGIGFANGIVIDRSKRRVVVAATREKALLVYDLERMIAGNAGRPIGRLSLDGGPDNLIMNSDNHVLAAVHPSLLSVGFYRRRWFNTTRAPAKVVEVDLSEAQTRTVYHDTAGEGFPAVTVAARRQDIVLMGSVGAPGLLVCRPPETEPQAPTEGT